MKRINYEEFQSLIKLDTPLLVDFYATWCAPCRAMQSILGKLEGMLGGDAEIVGIDIDAPENYKITQQYNIYSVPTLIIFRSEEMLWRTSGVVSAEYLKTIIAKLPAPVPPLSR